MTCPNCGATVAGNRRFCGKCGTDLTPEASGDAPPAPSPYATPAAPSAWGNGGAIAPAAAPAPPPSGPVDPFAPPNLDPGPYAGYPQPPGYGAPPGPGSPGPPPPVYPTGAPTWGGYGYAAPRVNGLAIASLVLGCTGWTLCGVGSVVAVVLGFVARSQIDNSQGRDTGSGMATAGIVLGFIGLAAWLALFIAALFSNSS